MIDLAILGLLKEHDLHGYELKKRIRDLLGPRSSVSYGSLYPALARLEKAGAVRTVDQPDPAAAALPIPASGSLTGELAALRHRLGGRAQRTGHRDRRGRKVFSITAAGEQRLRDLLGAADGDDRTFALRVAFCRYLAPEQRIAVFERRRAALAGELEATDQQPARKDSSRFDVYLHSLRDHDANALRNDIAWIDELIATTRSDSANAVVASESGGTHSPTTGGQR